MAAAVAFLGLALARLRTIARPLEAVPFRTSLRVVAIIPLPLLAVVAFGYFDGVTLALWVPFAFAQGLGEAAAALSLSAVIMGNVLLQFPIGWLADRMDRRRLFSLLAAATCLGAALLPLVDLDSTWGLLCLLVWGAAAFGLYTLSLILIGQHLTGMRLMAATAAFAVAWGLGGLIGPWVTGVLMDAFGPVMLALALAVVYGLLTLAALTIAPIRAQNLQRFHQARVP
jgi:MFS family permease